MKTSIILQLLALPAILAKFTVQIVTEATAKDVEVWGKRESDGEVMMMKHTMFGDDGIVPRCMDKDFKWTTSCPNQTTYLQSGELNFAVKTTEPRHLTVYVNNMMKRVSINILTQQTALIVQCSVTVTKEEGNVVWDFNEIWLDTPGGVEPEGIEIDCSRQT
jgi:hypothetical protein